LRRLGAYFAIKVLQLIVGQNPGSRNNCCVNVFGNLVKILAALPVGVAKFGQRVARLVNL
jgi:hypothetical protein